MAIWEFFPLKYGEFLQIFPKKPFACTFVLSQDKVRPQKKKKPKKLVIYQVFPLEMCWICSNCSQKILWTLCLPHFLWSYKILPQKKNEVQVICQTWFFDSVENHGKVIMSLWTTLITSKSLFLFLIIAQHWFKIETASKLFLWFLGLNSEVHFHFCFLLTDVLLDPKFLEIILSISFSIPS